MSTNIIKPQPVPHKATLAKELMAGGIAGIIEVLIGYPTDVIKTRAQLASGKGMNMIALGVKLVKEEGFGILYRGIASPIFAEAPKRATKFAFNERYKSLLKKSDGTLTIPRAFLAGAMAGATEMFVNCPFEVIKIQMQKPDAKSLYKNTLDCAVKYIKKEGLWGLYRGSEPHLWKNIMWNGPYFGMIQLSKTLFPQPKGLNPTQIKLRNFYIGTTAGLVATFLATPFDMIKSRVQAGTSRAGKYVLPNLIDVFSKEGFWALQRGLGPRLIRFGPGGGVMLVAFDAVLEMLNKLF